MTRPTELSAEAREEALKALPGWAYHESGKAINKSFKFEDFSEAWAFMNRAALLAEKMDHHPEWFNVYNRVEVRLTTHDAGGITQFDIDMATAMERFTS